MSPNFPTPFSILFLFLFLTLFHVSFSIELQHHVRSPTGLQLPTSLVHSSLPPYLRATNATSLLYAYDVATKSITFPNGTSLSLSSLSSTEPLTDPPATLFVENGRVNRNHAFRRARRRSFVRATSDGAMRATFRSNQLLTVDADGLMLRPVDLVKYPSTFVNVYKRVVSVEDTGARPSVLQTSSDSTLLTDDPPPPSDRRDTTIMQNAIGRSLSLSLSDKQGAAPCANGKKHHVEIALAFDYLLCTSFGGYDNTVSALRGMVSAANNAYKSTCVSIYITAFDGHCKASNNPYYFGNVNAVNTLYSFAAYALRNKKFIRRDTFHLLTGYADSTSTLGVAFRPGTCSNAGFGYVEGVDNQVFAHELAHNLGCPHRDEGLMTAYLNRDSFFFSPQSRQDLTQYLDSSTQADCISSSSTPSCDSTCPGTCTANKCNRPKRPANNKLVACSRARDVYICGRGAPVPVGFHMYQKVPCNASLPFVLRDYDANDNNIKCCADPAGNYVFDRAGVIGRDSLYTQRVTNIEGNVDTFANAISSVSVIYRFNSRVVPCNAQNTAPTPSRSPRPSKSSSPKPSKSRTPKPSPSTSPKSSKSRTPKPSKTRTPTPSPSKSSKPSKSRTPRPSRTSSPTPSPSKSSKPSKSRTPRPSRTSSPTPSTSKSSKPSKSRTPRPSRTSSPTPSPSKSSKPSKSRIPTPSPSRSAKPSTTRTASPSMTKAAKSTATPSTSETPSPIPSTSTSMEVMPSTQPISSPDSPISSPSTAASCGDFFKNSTKVFVCFSYNLAHNITNMNGRMRMKVQAQSDRFNFTLLAPKNWTVKTYSYAFANEGFIPTFSRVVRKTTFNRRVSEQTNVRLSQLPAKRRCCEKTRITAFVRVKICKKVKQEGKRRMCKNLQNLKFKFKPKCGRVCKKPNNKFKATPMGDGVPCPTCMAKGASR